MTPALRALIQRLDTESVPALDVEREDASELARLGAFRCYSCDNWYPAEDHYRYGCCLYCGDPCGEPEEGQEEWADGLPVAWTTGLIPEEALELLALFAATQGLELRPRWREGMEEPCALGYTASGEDFLAEHTAKDWYDAIRAVRVALMARCANV